MLHRPQRPGASIGITGGGERRRVANVSHPILLDEMFSGAIAEELRAKGRVRLA
jgi:hypothetical protein